MLTVENIKCELSYAYLHAVASRAGFNCQIGNRHEDNAGIDARISAYGFIDPNSVLTDFGLGIQLKATARRRTSPRARRDVYSFNLAVEHYDKLRNSNVLEPRILVVLFLPPQDLHWLVHKPDQLVARRCAYWVSLRGAAESKNRAIQTVYLPKENALTIEALKELMSRVSRQERIAYAG